METPTHEQLIDIRSLESLIRVYNVASYREFITMVNDPIYDKSFAYLARIYASHFQAYIHSV